MFSAAALIFSPISVERGGVLHDADAAAGMVPLPPVNPPVTEWTGTTRHAAGAFPAAAMRGFVALVLGFFALPALADATQDRFTAHLTDTATQKIADQDKQILSLIAQIETERDTAQALAAYWAAWVKAEEAPTPPPVAQAN